MFYFKIEIQLVDSTGAPLTNNNNNDTIISIQHEPRHQNSSSSYSSSNSSSSSLYQLKRQILSSASELSSPLVSLEAYLAGTFVELATDNVLDRILKSMSSSSSSEEETETEASTSSSASPILLPIHIHRLPSKFSQRVLLFCGGNVKSAVLDSSAVFDQIFSHQNLRQKWTGTKNDDDDETEPLLDWIKKYFVYDDVAVSFKCQDTCVLVASSTTSSSFNMILINDLFALAKFLLKEISSSHHHQQDQTSRTAPPFIFYIENKNNIITRGSSSTSELLSTKKLYETYFQIVKKGKLLNNENDDFLFVFLPKLKDLLQSKLHHEFDSITSSELDRHILKYKNVDFDIPPSYQALAWCVAVCLNFSPVVNDEVLKMKPVVDRVRITRNNPWRWLSSHLFSNRSDAEDFILVLKNLKVSFGLLTMHDENENENDHLHLHNQPSLLYRVAEILFNANIVGDPRQMYVTSALLSSLCSWCQNLIRSTVLLATATITVSTSTSSSSSSELPYWIKKTKDLMMNFEMKLSSSRPATPRQQQRRRDMMMVVNTKNDNDDDESMMNTNAIIAPSPVPPQKEHRSPNSRRSKLIDNSTLLTHSPPSLRKFTLGLPSDEEQLRSRKNSYEMVWTKKKAATTTPQRSLHELMNDYDDALSLIAMKKEAQRYRPPPPPKRQLEIDDDDNDDDDQEQMSSSPSQEEENDKPTPLVQTTATIEHSSTNFEQEESNKKILEQQQKDYIKESLKEAYMITKEGSSNEATTTTDDHHDQQQQDKTAIATTATTSPTLLTKTLSSITEKSIKNQRFIVLQLTRVEEEDERNSNNNDDTNNDTETKGNVQNAIIQIKNPHRVNEDEILIEMAPTEGISDEENDNNNNNNHLNSMMRVFVAPVKSSSSSPQENKLGDDTSSMHYLTKVELTLIIVNNASSSSSRSTITLTQCLDLSKLNPSEDYVEVIFPTNDEDDGDGKSSSSSYTATFMMEEFCTKPFAPPKTIENINSSSNSNNKNNNNSVSKEASSSSATPVLGSSATSGFGSLTCASTTSSSSSQNFCILHLDSLIRLCSGKELKEKIIIKTNNINNNVDDTADDEEARRNYYSFQIKVKNPITQAELMTINSMRMVDPAISSLSQFPGSNFVFIDSSLFITGLEFELSLLVLSPSSSSSTNESNNSNNNNNNNIILLGEGHLSWNDELLLQQTSKVRKNFVNRIEIDIIHLKSNNEKENEAVTDDDFFTLNASLFGVSVIEPIPQQWTVFSLQSGVELFEDPTPNNNNNNARRKNQIMNEKLSRLTIEVSLDDSNSNISSSTGKKTNNDDDNDDDDDEFFRAANKRVFALDVSPNTYRLHGLSPDVVHDTFALPKFVAKNNNKTKIAHSSSKLEFDVHRNIYLDNNNLDNILLSSSSPNRLLQGSITINNSKQVARTLAIPLKPYKELEIFDVKILNQVAGTNNNINDNSDTNNNIRPLTATGSSTPTQVLLPAIAHENSEDGDEINQSHYESPLLQITEPSPSNRRHQTRASSSISQQKQQSATSISETNNNNDNNTKSDNDDQKTTQTRRNRQRSASVMLAQSDLFAASDLCNAKNNSSSLMLIPHPPSTSSLASLDDSSSTNNNNNINKVTITNNDRRTPSSSLGIRRRTSIISSAASTNNSQQPGGAATTVSFLHNNSSANNITNNATSDELLSTSILRLSVETAFVTPSLAASSLLSTSSSKEKTGVLKVRSRRSSGNNKSNHQNIKPDYTALVFQSWRSDDHPQVKIRVRNGYHRVLSARDIQLFSSEIMSSKGFSSPTLLQNDDDETDTNSEQTSSRQGRNISSQQQHLQLLPSQSGRRSSLFTSSRQSFNNNTTTTQNNYIGADDNEQQQKQNQKNNNKASTLSVPSFVIHSDVLDDDWIALDVIKTCNNIDDDEKNNNNNNNSIISGTRHRRQEKEILIGRIAVPLKEFNGSNNNSSKSNNEPGLFSSSSGVRTMTLEVMSPEGPLRDGSSLVLSIAHLFVPKTIKAKEEQRVAEVGISTKKEAKLKYEAHLKRFIEWKKQIIKEIKNNNRDIGIHHDFLASYLPDLLEEFLKDDDADEEEGQQQSDKNNVHLRKFLHEQSIPIIDQAFPVNNDFSYSSELSKFPQDFSHIFWSKPRHFLSSGAVQRARMFSSFFGSNNEDEDSRQQQEILIIHPTAAPTIFSEHNQMKISPTVVVVADDYTDTKNNKIGNNNIIKNSASSSTSKELLDKGFINALTILQHAPVLIKRTFVEHAEDLWSTFNAFGVFLRNLDIIASVPSSSAVSSVSPDFFKMITDDWVPATTSSSVGGLIVPFRAFAGSLEYPVLWPSAMQKSVAKYFGSYECLSDLDLFSSMEMLSGLPCNHGKIRFGGNSDSADVDDEYDLYSVLTRRMKRFVGKRNRDEQTQQPRLSAICCLNTPSSSRFSSFLRSKGLDCDTSYVVLDIVEINNNNINSDEPKVMILCQDSLRPVSHWTGKFRKNSPFWKKYPEIKRQCSCYCCYSSSSSENDDDDYKDGTFWLTLQEAEQVFESFAMFFYPSSSSTMMNTMAEDFYETKISGGHFSNNHSSSEQQQRTTVIKFTNNNDKHEDQKFTQDYDNVILVNVVIDVSSLTDYYHHHNQNAGVIKDEFSVSVELVKKKKQTKNEEIVVTSSSVFAAPNSFAQNNNNKQTASSSWMSLLPSSKKSSSKRSLGLSFVQGQNDDNDDGNNNTSSFEVILRSKCSCRNTNNKDDGNNNTSATMKVPFSVSILSSSAVEFTIEDDEVTTFLRSELHNNNVKTKRVEGE